MPREMIEFRVNGRTARGYLSMPAEGGDGPGIVVIHQWWGLVDQIKRVADRLAAEGCVALAPDLYHGETTKLPDHAGRLMMALKIDEAEKEIGGAVNYLNEEAGTSRRIATLGFGMGGALSLHAAAGNRMVDACVDFYGIHPNVKPALSKLEAPLLGVFGDRDKLISNDYVRDLERTLRSLNKQVEIQTYPAGHGFFDDDRREVYEPRSAADSWHHTMDFLKRHLS